MEIKKLDDRTIFIYDDDYDNATIKYVSIEKGESFEGEYYQINKQPTSTTWNRLVLGPTGPSTSENLDTL